MHREMLDSDLSVHTSGLVGCFRGLVMNNEVVNLYAYMNARFPDMIQKHCRPSCDPNPCKNGATCAEFWYSAILFNVVYKLNTVLIELFFYS